MRFSFFLSQVFLLLPLLKLSPIAHFFSPRQLYTTMPTYTVYPSRRHSYHAHGYTPSHHSHHSNHSRSPSYSHSRHRQSYYPQVATTSYGNPGYSTTYYYPSTHSHHHSSHSRQPQYVTPTSYGNYYGSGSRRGGNYYVSDGSRSHHGGGHHYYQSGHVSTAPFFSVPKT